MKAEIEVLEPEVVGQELAKVERASGLAEDRAVALRGEFAPFYNSIVSWREMAAMVTQPEDAKHQKMAREIRLGLRKVRCEVENTRKALKLDSLARGKAIDGFANVLKYLCEPVEEKLLEVEQYAERQEAARIAALTQERAAVLVAVESDPTAYNLGQMDDETFALVLDAAKKRQAERIEADRKAEADRIAKEKAEAEERERIRAENERLKKEAAAREAEVSKERAKVDAEREKAELRAAEIVRQQEEQRRKEREAAEAKMRELEAKAKVEREAREKMEREAAAAKAKEAARVKAEAEAKAKAERAPDKDKLKRFVQIFDALTIPAMTTESGKIVAGNIRDRLGDFEEWLRKQVETL